VTCARWCDRGLGRGEALGLTWGDVDVHTGAIPITHRLQRIPDRDDPSRTRLAQKSVEAEGLEPSNLLTARYSRQGPGMSAGVRKRKSHCITKAP
jgi:hypothetical protein